MCAYREGASRHVLREIFQWFVEIIGHRYPKVLSASCPASHLSGIICFVFGSEDVFILLQQFDYFVPLVGMNQNTSAAASLGEQNGIFPELGNNTRLPCAQSTHWHGCHGFIHCGLQLTA